MACRRRPTLSSPALTVEGFLSDGTLDAAYTWLCQRRRRFPADADVWDFRRRWPVERERLRAKLRAGTYRFGCLTRTTLASGEEVDIWSARDALVLKWLTLALAPHLGIAAECCHLKGNGGSKRAVRDVLAHLSAHRFVMKTDIAGFYASIDHDRLLDRLAPLVSDRRLLNLVGQYLRRTAERGGLFWQYESGIPLGCSLSPLLGAFFLREVDADLQRLGCFFRRYMDDILVLAPTRWQLRRAVAIVNRRLDTLGLDRAPTKTFIGRIERGFDFLGYRFGRDGLAIAPACAAQFVERVTRLYEQERDGACNATALGTYVRRWRAWAAGGLGATPVALPTALGMSIAHLYHLGA